MSLPLLLARAKAEVASRERMKAMKGEAEADFLAFVRMMWPVLEPERPLVEGWLLDLLCDVLMAVTDGDMTRVCINVPPGSTKPVHIDELIMTDRGPIRIADVVVGDRVLTHRGRYRHVSAVHEQGVLPTVVVCTNDGRRVRTEGSHPFLTTRGWLPAGKIKPGDICAAVFPLEEVFPEEVTPEDARLMGYFVGDGCLTQGQTRFVNLDEEVLADFIHCAISAGLAAKVSISPSHDIRRAKTVHVTAGSAGYGSVKRWLEKHELWKRSSYTKRIPSVILRSSKRIIANFLGAYWSCDGNVSVRHEGVRGDKHVASCTTVSKHLAEDIQHALLRIGIVGRIRTRTRTMETKRQAGGKYVFYQVMSQSHEEAVKFQRLEGLCSRKRQTLDCMTPQRFVQGPLLEDEVTAVEAAEPGECRCLTVEEDHSFTAGGLAVHNSTLLNVLWPAWEWGPCNRPGTRYISVSYSTDVPVRDNLRFARILKHPVYQACWGDRVKVIRDGAEWVGNDRTGFKMVTSTSGGTTGFRGDRLLLDDLNNPISVESDTVRSTTNKFIREVMPDRLNDLARSAIINLQQRTHRDDATGNLIEFGQGYEFVCVPMEFDPLRICKVTLQRDINGKPKRMWVDPRSIGMDGKQLKGLVRNSRGEPHVIMGSPMAQATGESCWPERFDEESVAKLKLEKGAYAWDSQYQQIPGVRGGAVIMRDWWKLWPSDDYPTLGTVVVSVDTAIEEKETNDWNAVTAWGAFAGKQGEPLFLLLAAWKIRTNLANLVRLIAETCRERRADYLLIEHKTRGRDVSDEIKRLYATATWDTVLVKPEGDKLSRLKAVSHLFSGDVVRRDPTDKRAEDTEFAPEPDGKTRADMMVYRGGVVYAPDKEWADEVITQVADFPYSAHDDYCDTVSQALGWCRKHGVVLRKTEFEDDEFERNRFRKPLGIPYHL